MPKLYMLDISHPTMLENASMTSLYGFKRSPAPRASKIGVETQTNKRRLLAGDFLRFGNHRLQRDAMIGGQFSRFGDSANTSFVSHQKQSVENQLVPNDAFARSLIYADFAAETDKKSREIDAEIQRIDDLFVKLNLENAQKTLDLVKPKPKPEPEPKPESKPEIKPEAEFEEEPEIVPLTAEERQEVTSFLNQRVSSNTVVAKAFRIDLTLSELVALKPGKWLDDHVIDIYLAAQLDNLKQVYVFSALFMTTLKEFGLKRTKKRLKGFKNIFEPEKLIIPLHVHGNHWTLAVVDNKKKSIYYYDSMSGYEHQDSNNKPTGKTSSSIHELRLLKEYLQIQSEVLGTGDSEYLIYDRMPCPQQHNGSDCGVFMCETAVRVARNQPLTHKQSDMPTVRQRMALCILKLRS